MRKSHIHYHICISTFLDAELHKNRHAIICACFWHKKCILSALSNLPLTSDVFIGFPLRKAPQCLLAKKNCLMRGLYIIPISAFLFTSRAKEMHVCGKRWTKLVVPSIGSIIHVGSSVSCGNRPSFATVSSAINLKD